MFDSKHVQNNFFYQYGGSTSNIDLEKDFYLCSELVIV